MPPRTSDRLPSEQEVQLKLTAWSIGIGRSVDEHDSRRLLDERAWHRVSGGLRRYAHAVGPTHPICASLDVERQRDSVDASQCLRYVR
jgi:hypothetical protein